MTAELTAPPPVKLPPGVAPPAVVLGALKKEPFWWASWAVVACSILIQVAHHRGWFSISEEMQVVLSLLQKEMVERAALWLTPRNTWTAEERNAHFAAQLERDGWICRPPGEGPYR